MKIEEGPNKKPRRKPKGKEFRKNKTRKENNFAQRNYVSNRKMPNAKNKNS